MQKRLLRTLPYILFILTIIPLLAASAAEGGDRETAALARQIQELQQKVEGLDTRVRELERRCSTQPAPGLQDRGNTGGNLLTTGEEESHDQAAEGTAETHPAESPSVADKEKQSLPQLWRSLKRGMTAEAVEALLGLPQRVIEVDSKTVWYYRYPNIGAGSIVFTPDKLVSAWQKPPFHGWW